MPQIFNNFIGKKEKIKPAVELMVAPNTADQAELSTPGDRKHCAVMVRQKVGKVEVVPSRRNRYFQNLWKCFSKGTV